MFVLIIIVFHCSKGFIVLQALFMQRWYCKAAPGLNGSSKLWSHVKKNRSSSNFITYQKRTLPGSTRVIWTPMIQSAGPGEGVLWLCMVLRRLFWWECRGPLMDNPFQSQRRQRQLPRGSFVAQMKKVSKSTKERCMYVLYISSLSLYLASVIRGRVAVTTCFFS